MDQLDTLAYLNILAVNITLATLLFYLGDVARGHFKTVYTVNVYLPWLASAFFVLLTLGRVSGLTDSGYDTKIEAYAPQPLPIPEAVPVQPGAPPTPVS